MTPDEGMKPTLEFHRSKERDQRMETRILYGLCLALMILALYTLHRCNQACETVNQLQPLIITKGATNK